VVVESGRGEMGMGGMHSEFTNFRSMCFCSEVVIARKASAVAQRERTRRLAMCCGE
jgi:hypothetical protein